MAARTIAAKRVKLVWQCDFYDGVLSGVCLVDDVLHWFQTPQDIDTHPREYLVYELTDAEMRELLTNHVLFEIHVGVHGCYHLETPRLVGNGVRPQATHHLYYDRFLAENRTRDYTTGKTPIGRIGPRQMRSLRGH